MKFTSQLIQNQFSKVGRIFPKPDFKKNSSLDVKHQNGKTDEAIKIGF